MRRPSVAVDSLDGGVSRTSEATTTNITMPAINAINERLAKLADGERVRFLNVNDKLADESGRLRPGMMHDGLHPSVPGYQVWADGLKPLLTELLGPPAATDQAPPPTGDPSATAGRP